MERKRVIFSEKRGMSPLIATVLLIAFAVALGAVIMNISNTIIHTPPTTDNGEQACEQGIGLAVHDANGPLIKYGGSGENGYIQFTIDNVGTSRIEGIIIFIDGEIDGRLVQDRKELAEPFEAGGLFIERKIPYDFSKFGIIKQIEFRPKVVFNGQVVPCSKASLKVTNIAAELP